MTCYIMKDSISSGILEMNCWSRAVYATVQCSILRNRVTQKRYTASKSIAIC